MKDVGRELAEARERRAMSLSELSRRTKISVLTLRAIERNDLRQLPGGLYTRGMLRAYAREVGRDPEEIIDRFRLQSGDQEVENDQTSDQSPQNAAAVCRAGQVHAADIDAMDRRRGRAQAIAGCVALLLGAVLFFSSHRPAHSPTRSRGSSVETPAVNVAAMTSQPVQDAPPTRAETGTAGSLDPPRPVDEASELRLDIQPRGLCWLSATADGQQQIYRLVNLGERIQIEAKQEILLRIGDPAMFAFTINGVNGRPTGTAGQAVTVHLTRQNYQDFLSR